MLDFLKQFLTGNASEEKVSESNHTRKIQVASCALLLEIANADDDFSDNEREKIIEIMKNSFDITTDYVNELIELAENKIRDSVSIYEFTDLINQHFSKYEKFEIMVNLWRLIYSDEQLDKHEDHLAKRIGNNLKFEHREIIEAKLIAKEELK